MTELDRRLFQGFGGERRLRGTVGCGDHRYQFRHDILLAGLSALACKREISSSEPSRGRRRQVVRPLRSGRGAVRSGRVSRSRRRRRGGRVRSSEAPSIRAAAIPATMASPAPTVDRTVLAGRAAASAVSLSTNSAPSDPSDTTTRATPCAMRARAAATTSAVRGQRAADEGLEFGAVGLDGGERRAALERGRERRARRCRARRGRRSAARSATRLAQAVSGMESGSEPASTTGRPGAARRASAARTASNASVRDDETRQVDVGGLAGRPVGDLDVGPGLAGDPHEVVRDRLAGEEIGEGAVVGAAEHAGRGDADAPVGEAAGDVDALAAAIGDRRGGAVDMAHDQMVEGDGQVDRRIEGHGDDVGGGVERSLIDRAPSSARTRSAVSQASASVAEPSEIVEPGLAQARLDGGHVARGHRQLVDAETGERGRRRTDRRRCRRTRRPSVRAPPRPSPWRRSGAARPDAGCRLRPRGRGAAGRWRARTG